MKLEKPNRIAICLNAPSIKRALEQKEMLIGIEEMFEVEWDIRAERHEGLYLSFSQMINEAVYLSESEYMIFINPKSEPKPEDIEIIISDLCSGFCLSTIIAFGFWGTTKQLFREVGLLDERFLGGGWEDLDFMNRLKIANKAVRFRYYYEMYSNKGRQNISEDRVIAHSVYHDKWLNIDGQTYYNPEYLDKKMPKGEIVKTDKTISNSWMFWNDSIVDDLPNNIWQNADDLKINDNSVELIQKDIIFRFSFSLKVDELGRLVTFVLGESGTKVTFTITQQENFKEYTIRNTLLTAAIDSGAGICWAIKPDISKYYSIRIAVQGRIVYKNDYIKIPFNTGVFNIKAKTYEI